jgi:hypothetical protein
MLLSVGQIICPRPHKTVGDGHNLSAARIGIVFGGQPDRLCGHGALKGEVGAGVSAHGHQRYRPGDAQLNRRSAGLQRAIRGAQRPVAGAGQDVDVAARSLGCEQPSGAGLHN